MENAPFQKGQCPIQHAHFIVIYSWVSQDLHSAGHFQPRLMPVWVSAQRPRLFGSLAPSESMTVLGFSSGNSGMDHESNDVKFMVKLKVLVSLCPRAPVSPLRRLARGRQCNWQICSKKRRSWELRGTLVITWNHMGGFPKIWVPLGTPKSSINYYFMFFF